MTTYDQIFAEGFEIGMEEAMKEAKVELLLRRHDSKLEISLLSKILELSESEIIKIL